MNITEQIKRVYGDSGDEEYSMKLSDVLDVFETYFNAYKNKTGREHPRLKDEQIEQITSKLPFCTYCDEDIPLDADCYRDMIDLHFKTRYSTDCDWNMNHFMSGNIRALRFYEGCY